MTDEKPDLLAVLQHYGVEARDGRVEQLVKCPHPDHPETHASMTLNLVKGLFSCKACGFAGDSYTMIQAMEGIDFAAAITVGKDRFGAAGPGVPARGGRRGLHGSAGPARGGYRPAFKRAGFRRGSE